MIVLHVDVPESARRFLKAQAAVAGKNMGRVIVDLLIEHTSYRPPAEKKDRRVA